ncbi:MAG: hypothetical protein K2H17_00535 [Duncaniella sp.]|uniref:hypothetical protein n=1 Tax=Duncaniella sp. TaxID=2518496 RepID=UPI0023D67D01|nr:hypothetical protein [Duncaniella sp.]MDE5987860.1 hypothetical protein [Duncaniella sp.]
MIKKSYLFPSLVAMLAVTATSCIDDNSTYGGNPLPGLSVTVPGDTEMPIYSFNYGEDCVITPEINYDGSRELTYEWSIGTYSNSVKGPLEFVSNEKTLVHFFPQGGSYYAHLVVSDGEVGIVQDYEISINRTFEQGYMIISNNAAGEGNLVFIKDLTREEIEAGIPQTIMENCLQRVNPNIGNHTLIGSQIIQWYAWGGSGPVQTNRLAVMTSDEGLYVDPNTFVVSSTIKSNDIISGFKGSQFFMEGITPVIVDNSANKYLSLNSQYMFGYESSLYKEAKFDLIQNNTYYVGLNQVSDVYFVNLSPLVFSITAAYSPTKWSSSNTIDAKDENGNPFFTNEELIAIFKGEGIVGEYGATSYPATLFTRNKTTGQLYVTAFSGIGAYTTGMILAFRNKINTTASSAMPDMDSQIICSNTYHRSFFSKANQVFVMLKNENTYTFPSTSQAAVTFPSDEEITYMTISTQTGSEELIIATANKNTGRGNLYFYDVKDVRTDNPDPAPKSTYLNCADRISYITYKPRIAN